LFEKLGDRRRYLLAVLRKKRQHAIRRAESLDTHLRSDGPILIRGELCDLRKHEELRSELFQVSDTAFYFPPADAQVLATEFVPIARHGAVQFFIADSAEALDVGGGTPTCHQGESVTTAHPTAQIHALLHSRDRVGLVFRCCIFHEFL